ncbi:3-dehydroquinate dehydratase [Spirochaetia bacterium]|nr:3-dehydroquinate dehydratase [Spirochaetia bacterium]
MSRVCLCLTGKTIARDLEILEKYRKYVDIAELRVDCLDDDEQFQIRRFPELAGVPVILTNRRIIDGGRFSGGEGARIIIFSRALAFASADRRKNFAYVDLEEDLNVPSLEEAARTFGTRIIRSYHNMHGVDKDIPGKLRGLRRIGDEIAKAALMPRSLADVSEIYRAAKETAGMDKILIAMGSFGMSTRVLAKYIGSWLTYTSIKDEADFPPAAEGQLDPKELTQLYRFKKITAKTKIFAVTGFPLQATASPAFFNSVFNLENTDAVYIPVPADSIRSFLNLAEEIGIQGVSITVPYKEAVLPYLFSQSEKVGSIGACNTIIKDVRGWLGFNTDATGFSDSLLDFAGKKDLRWKKVTLIGAGGAARAVAAELSRLKAKVLILNRGAARARDLAGLYDFDWGCFDNRGLQLMEKHTDIIIQATPVGMEPDIDADPLEMYHFSGKELVLDIVYKPEQTRFLKRAAAAGCRTRNGYDMLIRQAQYQYAHFMGREFPLQLMSRINTG